MKTTRIFQLKVFIFYGKILNIFEQACFRNECPNLVSGTNRIELACFHKSMYGNERTMKHC